MASLFNNQTATYQKHGCPKCSNVKKYKTNEAIQMLKR